MEAVEPKSASLWPFHAFGRGRGGLFFRFSAAFSAVGRGRWTAGFVEISARVSVAHGALIKK
jgi:hypothetical protein